MTSAENRATQGNEERGEVRHYPFDLVVVLGARNQRVGDRFLPSEYNQSDGRGMLGGWARVAAAGTLYMQGLARNFHFIGARTLPVEHDADTSRYIREFATLPTEATVYKDAFVDALNVTRANANPTFAAILQELEPEIATADEDTAVDTTLASLEKMAQDLSEQTGVRQIAIPTNEYHIERLERQLQKLQLRPKDVGFTLISAEWLLMKAYPGVYDDHIIHAYNTPLARRRFYFEQKGIEALEVGNYNHDGVARWI